MRQATKRYAPIPSIHFQVIPAAGWIGGHRPFWADGFKTWSRYAPGMRQATKMYAPIPGIHFQVIPETKKKQTKTIFNDFQAFVTSGGDPESRICNYFSMFLQHFDTRGIFSFVNIWQKFNDLLCASRFGNSRQNNGPHTKLIKDQLNAMNIDENCFQKVVNISASSLMRSKHNKYNGLFWSPMRHSSGA